MTYGASGLNRPVAEGLAAGTGFGVVVAAAGGDGVSFGAAAVADAAALALAFAAGCRFDAGAPTALVSRVVGFGSLVARVADGSGAIAVGGALGVAVGVSTGSALADDGGAVRAWRRSFGTTTTLPAPITSSPTAPATTLATRARDDALTGCAVTLDCAMAPAPPVVCMCASGCGLRSTPCAGEPAVGAGPVGWANEAGGA